MWENEDREGWHAAPCILAAIAISALLLVGGAALYGAVKAWFA